MAAPAAPPPLEPRPPTLAEGLAIAVLKWTDRVYPWYKWPDLLALTYLVARRILLRRNLINVPQPRNTPLRARLAATPTLPDNQRPLRREDDAFGNDGANPGAGSLGATIGRNMAPRPTELRMPDGDPSPQFVAQTLLARRRTPGGGTETGFRPAGMQLNVMAAAWIQTMIHDWQDHEPSADTATLSDGAARGCPLSKFTFFKTLDAAGPGEASPAYLNRRTGWWDASFLYGQSPAAVAAARTGSGGALRLDAKGHIPTAPDGACEIGDQRNAWIGVALLQELFAREHNAIAAAIAAEDPSLDDDRLYDLARLAVAAIAAKIHTTDWTVELLKTSLLKTAMNANWTGLLGLGPTGFGLVGAKRAKNHGVPYALTEEFTAVYRLHPLLPDYLPLDDKTQIPIDELFASKGQLALRNGTEPYLRSVLKYPCGALTLFNYPTALRSIPITDESGRPLPEQIVDLAALDIFRDRERGVQRYNEFRRKLDMNPMRDWAELTGNDADAIAALTEVYGDDIEKCDLLVGNLAEKKIPGFAISETSFHIFLVMASRRLEADRFLTEHFNADVYSKTGFDWVTRTKSLRDVLKRHFPTLERELPPDASAFTPYEAMPAAQAVTGGSLAANAQ